jgi:hypothetical protein
MRKKPYLSTENGRTDSRWVPHFIPYHCQFDTRDVIGHHRNDRDGRPTTATHSQTTTAARGVPSPRPVLSGSPSPPLFRNHERPKPSSLEERTVVAREVAVATVHRDRGGLRGGGRRAAAAGSDRRSRGAARRLLLGAALAFGRDRSARRRRRGRKGRSVGRLQVPEQPGQGRAARRRLSPPRGGAHVFDHRRGQRSGRSVPARCVRASSGTLSLAASLFNLLSLTPASVRSSTPFLPLSFDGNGNSREQHKT